MGARDSGVKDRIAVVFPCVTWALLDATLSAVDQPVLARAAQLTVRHQGVLIPEHQRMLAAIIREAGISESAPV